MDTSSISYQILSIELSKKRSKLTAAQEELNEATEEYNKYVNNVTILTAEIQQLETDLVHLFGAQNDSSGS